MKTQTTMIFLSPVLLIVFWPGWLMGQTDGAMLYAQGNVKVNGTNVAYSSSIFAGDQLETAGASAVSINKTGSSVVVSSNSLIKYDSSSVEIMSGTARVSTSKGMSAQAGQIIVAPKTGVAKFDMVMLDGKVTVASREGALTVNDGGRTTTLTPGSTATVLLSPAAGKATAPGQGSSTGVAENSAGFLSEAPFYSAGAPRDDGTGPSPCSNPPPICQKQLTPNGHCGCVPQ